MPSTVHVASGWVVMTVIELLFVIAYPLVLGLIARRRLGVGWKYFWFGALVFLVVQLLTRVPAVIVLHAGLDFVTVAISQLWGSSATITLIVEGIVLIAGLLALWIVWRLREPVQPAVQDSTQAPVIAG